MNNAYKKIIKATTLFGGVQGLNILINLVRTKLAAWLLGPAGVGINSIYNETRELIHETTNCGMDQSGIRDISKSFERVLESDDELQSQAAREELKKQISLLRSWELLLALLGMFVTILLAEPLSLMTFQDRDHIWGYILLSPAIALSTISCGEMVILKAVRKLKAVAALSSINVMLALIVTIPIYYIGGFQGIIPALVALSLASALVTAGYSYRVSQPIVTWRWSDLRLGIPMLKLGGCFVLTGIMSHGMELVIMSFLNNRADEVIVGLYRAGYTITNTYASILFTAVTADFFPRLSGIIQDPDKRSTTVRQQMEVLIMMVGPLVTALLVLLPVLIPTLFTDQFTDIIPMTRIAVFGILLSSIYLPAALLPLASGESKLFLFVETVSTITMSLIMVGFLYGGLAGIGVGKLISTAIDTFVVLMLAYRHYHISLSRKHCLLIFTSLALLSITYLLTDVLDGWSYWVAGALMVLISALISWRYSQSSSTR